MVKSWLLKRLLIEARHLTTLSELAATRWVRMCWWLAEVGGAQERVTQCGSAPGDEHPTITTLISPDPGLSTARHPHPPASWSLLANKICHNSGFTSHHQVCQDYFQHCHWSLIPGGGSKSDEFYHQLQFPYQDKDESDVVRDVVRDRDYSDLDSERRVSRRTPDLRTVSKQQSPSPDNSQVTQDIYIVNRKVKFSKFKRHNFKTATFRANKPLIQKKPLPLMYYDWSWTGFCWLLWIL